MTYLALSVWARSCGRTYNAAKYACAQGNVPGALPFQSTPAGAVCYIVPAGTPWPAPRPAEVPPPGYIPVKDWARQVGRTVRSVRNRFRDIPEAKAYGPGKRWRCIPAGLPWPPDGRKPQPRGGVELHPGAGESSGGRPAQGGSSHG